jgi:hypothetical protein
MKAYEATITKTEFVRELKKHQKADDFIRGTYFNSTSGKGCAVGCSLESVSRLKKLKFSFDDHTLYEKHLGIPEWLARVEDTLFEGMTEERSKTWPVEFAEAIHPGADLEKVRVPFIVMLLEHTLQSMDSVKFDREKWPDVAKAIEGSRAAVKQMIKAQKSGDRGAIDEARSAALSAYSAAYSAYSAAYSAYSAAYSAYSAALSAYSAARSAYSAARSAYSAARSADSAARSAAYNHYADRLIEMLKGCKAKRESGGKG